MVEINKNYVRVKGHAGSLRVVIPSWKAKELELEHNALVDLSELRKVVEKNHPL